MTQPVPDFQITLHRGQVQMLRRFLRSKARHVRRFVACVSRRWGKSTALCALALWWAMAHPGAQIRYAAPTAKQVYRIIQPIIRKLVATMAPSAQPRFSRQDGCWRFPNGSEWWIAGVNDGHADDLLGTGTDLAIVDEAGRVTDLEYLIESVLLPQTLTNDGYILIASTPAPTPDHAFRRYCERAANDNALYRATIHDAGHVSDDKIAEYARETIGGVTGTTWRREYLVEDVVEQERAVVPEWVEHSVHCIIEHPTPRFRVRLVSMDPGFTALTAIVFGYYDFRAARVVVEHELAMRRANTAEIADAIRQKEREIWPDAKPALRVSDVDMRLITDLSSLYKIDFVPTAKDDKEAALNALRIAVQRHVLLIHPRCKETIAQLGSAIWNVGRSDYAKDSDGGHFDFIDALVYFVRNVDRHTNPWPEYEDGVSPATHHIPDRKPRNAAITTLFRRSA